MPTRTASKPADATGFSATGHGANMIMGWIFTSDTVSGSSITDVTGNGHTATLTGAAAIVSTDATHGDCVEPDTTPAGGFELTTVPSVLTSLTDYSVMMSVQWDNTASASDEFFFYLDNSGGSQDPIRIYRRSSEAIRATLEDSDTSNVHLTTTNTYPATANNWVSVMLTLDSATGNARLYCVDNDGTTEEIQSDATGISGTTSADLFYVFYYLYGRGEYCYIWDTVKSKADFEALHADPYSMFASSGSATPEPAYVAHAQRNYRKG